MILGYKKSVIIAFVAGMVELVDTQASGACRGNPVEVRVLFPVPFFCPLQKNISSAHEKK